MKLAAQTLSLEKSTEKTHIIGVFEDNAKGSGKLQYLQQLASDDVFKGKKGSSYFIRSFNGEANLLLVGLGKASELTSEILRNAGANLAKKLDGEKVKSAALAFDSFRGKGVSKRLDTQKAAQALSEGILLALYNFDEYKSEKTKAQLHALHFISKDRKTARDLQAAIHVAEAEYEAIKIARDLSNEPGDVLTPLELAKRAQKYAKEYGISCKVLEGKALEKENMNGIIAVGQGSSRPPCFIFLEYKPKKARKTIAFVGKGVTFDSGGISIKPGANMEDMKHDMSGSADVLAAILLCAKLKVPNHVICAIAAAENMPGGKAIVPSTIIKSRSGKTVEVQNTDAEGRLVLMDALDFVQEHKPDAIVDVATLTGAVVVALSNIAAGIMGNSPELMKKFKAAADKTDEKFWELPLYKEYSDDMKSKIADLKNIGSSGTGAGSQKGGAFLQEFIKKDMKWIHVDVAGTAWGQGHLAYAPKNSATGHSVRTLFQLALDY